MDKFILLFDAKTNSEHIFPLENVVSIQCNFNKKDQLIKTITKIKVGNEIIELITKSYDIYPIEQIMSIPKTKNIDRPIGF